MVMWDRVTVTQSSHVGEVEFSTEMSQCVADIMPVATWCEHLATPSSHKDGQLRH